MLENADRRFTLAQRRNVVILDRRGAQRVFDHRIRNHSVLMHRVARRPHISRTLRRVDAVGIDAAREQQFVVLIDPRLPQRELDERVHRERGQMSIVENDRIAQQDRTFVVRVARRNREDFARSCASRVVPVDEVLARESAGKRQVLHCGADSTTPALHSRRALR